MGPLGFTEILFILLLALLLFGPRRLPELGKAIGRGLAEFRRTSNELRATVEDEVRNLENAADSAPSVRPAASAPPGTEPKSE